MNERKMWAAGCSVGLIASLAVLPAASDIGMAWQALTAGACFAVPLVGWLRVPAAPDPR